MIEYTVKVWSNGTKIWYLNGQRHREGGPAVERADGSKEWWLNDKPHREGGPAVERANGTKRWYLNGKPHREGGPAHEWANGTKWWYLNGKRLTEEEHCQQTQPEPTCEGKTVEIDGKTYVLTLKES